MPRGIRPPIDSKRRGLLQEVDDLADLVLRLVHAGDVLERDGDLLQVDGARPLERRHAAGHHAVEHQAGDAEEEQAHAERGVAAGAGGLGFAHFEPDAALGQVR